MDEQETTTSSQMRSPDTRVPEYEQLCESIRALENALWVAATAYLAAMSYAVFAWLPKLEGTRQYKLMALGFVCVLQVIAILILWPWANAALSMYKRVELLSKELRMDSEPVSALRRARQRGKWGGAAFLVVLLIVTMLVFWLWK